MAGLAGPCPGTDGVPTFISGEDAWKFISGALERSRAAGTPWENKITLQSFYQLARSEPQNFVQRLAPRHVLHLAAEHDPLTAPLETHRKVFEAGANPNAQFAVVKPDHLATYYGLAFEHSVGIQVNFLRERFLRGRQDG
jgi:hypothetical protein